MATPIAIDIITNIGLEIEINAISDFDGVDYTDSSTPWEYTVTNYDKICTAMCTKVNHQKDLKGWLSPTSPITLPPMIKKKAGVPPEAVSYAFMNPPQGLAEILLKRDGQVSESDSPASESINRQGIKSAAILGGFAYFDEDYKCIRINALSLEKSVGSLRFSGPFRVNESVCEELYTSRRPQPLRLDIFQEIGFVSYAWVRPNETFKYKSVFVTDEHTEIHPNSNGTMLFLRENGTGVAYAVDQTEYVDPSGYVGILSAAVKDMSQAKLIEQVIQPIDEIKAWRDQVKYRTKAMAIGKLTVEINDEKSAEIKDERRLLHMVCHAALGHDFLSNVLQYTNKANLSHQDSFSWNPLHYACRFSPRDDKLIKLLVTEYPDAVTQLDYYNRSPLHIACNSDTSEEVVAILLKADKSSNKVIYTETRKLGFLPLHLACFNGASDGIINALLDADCTRMTAIKKSKHGQLPLHLAILKKLPAGMVKTFLDADSKLSKGDRYASDTVAAADIYQPFDGKLPLQLACSNNSSSEIIQLLLQKDKQNTTINMKVKTISELESEESAVLDQYTKMKQKYTERSTLSLTKSLKVSSESRFAASFMALHGPLHLAMRYGSSDVISLLLQKEMEKGTDGYNSSMEMGTEMYHSSMLHQIDSLGRTPLHIACHYNVDHQIIQSLLNLDPYRETTQMQCFQGFMPLHYACENKDTSEETIYLLLEAEKKLIKSPKKKKKCQCRSTHTGDDERNRTPLYLAVKAGAKTKVIEKLLQPEHLYLYGFDDPALGDLADIVKESEALQKKIINRLSERSHFSLLLLEFYACSLALVCFMVGSEKLVSGNISRIEPSLLILSATVFTLRELVQIKSVGTNYIGDLWSWFEIGCIICLLLSSSVMLQEVENPGYEIPSNLLLCTNFFVIAQFIIYLRSTFLSFARFVGGLLMIIRKLIAFLVVSLLLILAFAYAFWIGNRSDIGCSNISECLIKMIGNLFDFSPSEIGVTEIAFGVIIVIVLLNVVIAIVGEAWRSSAEKSTRLFWMFRLEKILQMQCVLTLRETQFASVVRRLTMNIDSMESISYGDDISWTKPPYDILTEKVHYDNPRGYFSDDLARCILGAHSLQADMYWADIHAQKKDTHLLLCDKFFLLLKWLGHCLLYVILIILGIPLCGITWPKKFREGVLSLGNPSSTVDSDETGVGAKVNSEPHGQNCKAEDSKL